MALPPTTGEPSRGRRGGARPPACWSVPGEKAQTAELPPTASDRTGQKQASQAASFAKGLAGAPGQGSGTGPLRPAPPEPPTQGTCLARTAVRGWRSREQRRQGCAPCCGTGGQNGLTRGQGGGGLGQKHQGASSGSAPGSPRGLPNTEHESCTLPVGGHCGSTVTPSGAPGCHPAPASQSRSGKEGKSCGIQQETWGEARGGWRPRGGSLARGGLCGQEREGRAQALTGVQGYRAQPSLTATRVCKQGPAQGPGAERPHALAEAGQLQTPETWTGSQ